MEKQEKELIVEDDALEAILACAVRYCLGRRTYMPSIVCGWIQPRLPYLKLQTLLCMERDIASCENYGDDCDVKLWSFFLTDILGELDKRSQKAQSKI